MNLHRQIILSCGLLVCALGHFPSGIGRGSALAATAPIGVGTKMHDVRATAIATSGAAPHNAAVGVATGNPLWAIPLRLMSATRERPLFSPSRRPPPPAIAAAPPPPPPAKPAPPPQPQLTLIGTVLGEGRSIGVFVDQTTKGIVRLSTGEGHDGWTLQSVQERAATLERDRRDVTLALPASKPTDQATASIPPPAPAPPQAEQEASVPPGMWRDGDGQIISPPASKAANAPPAPAAATWRDGDGQPIAAPQTQIAHSAQD